MEQKKIRRTIANVFFAKQHVGHRQDTTPPAASPSRTSCAHAWTDRNLPARHRTRSITTYHVCRSTLPVRRSGSKPNRRTERVMRERRCNEPKLQGTNVVRARHFVGIKRDRMGFRERELATQPKGTSQCVRLGPRSKLLGPRFAVLQRRLEHREAFNFQAFLAGTF